MKVWDLGTRLYHWLQVVLFIGLLASGLSGSGPHIQLGLVLFTLLLWRIIWGFVGSETSRFCNFLSSTSRVYRYLKYKEDHKPGHNPAGGWMVVAMISALFLQCLSGLALAGFLDGLPYSEVWLTDNLFALLESTHLVLVKVLPALVCVHVLAILVYKFRSQPLTWAMITGYQKSLSTHRPVQLAPSFHAVLALISAILITLGLTLL